MPEIEHTAETDDLIARLKDITANPETSIQAEIKRSPTVMWLSGFNTLTTLLSLEIEAERNIEPGKKEKIKQKLQTLIEKAEEIKRINGFNPPDKLKQELLAELRAIIE